MLHYIGCLLSQIKESGYYNWLYFFIDRNFLKYIRYGSENTHI